MNLIILCGGTGSRLWPLSRQGHPKQFVSILSNASLLDGTISRFKKNKHIKPLFVSHDDYRFVVLEHVHRSPWPDSRILLEPVARNTAPAIALAAHDIVSRQGDGLMLVCPSDHLILEEEKFQDAITNAIPLAEDGYLVTFGVKPSSPETGFGYIQRGMPLKDGYVVRSFKEKPNHHQAQEFIQTGHYYWNAGIFLFRASTYLAALQENAEGIFEATKDAMTSATEDSQFIRPQGKALELCPSNSIDYAVMEKSSNVAVIPLEVTWSDAGSWSSVWDLKNKDAEGNVLKGDVISRETKNSYVHSTHRLISTIGLDNIVIVETADAVLVANKDQVQDVKKIVNDLEAASRSEALHHRYVFRPWGMYDSIENGNRYQVKRIHVQPGAKLSIQMHHHRAEHWIVVAGTAKVMVNNVTKLLTENESVYIPIGAIHSLENPGKIPLELIEVQSGSYLGEDDIIRFEDSYGRV